MSNREYARNKKKQLYESILKAVFSYYRKPNSSKIVYYKTEEFKYSD